MKSLAEECINYRAFHGISQQQFADMVGLHRLTIFSIENERHKPNKTTEARIRMYIRGERPNGTY